MAQPSFQPGARVFQSTRWSVILAAADPAAPNSQKALASLCKTYWYPLYAYVRRLGHDEADAEDMTQAFFAKVIEKGYLRDVGPEKGKFRTYLLVCLKRFMANEWDRKNAQKRGGGISLISMDGYKADQRYQIEPVDGLTPDLLFERRWALTLIHDVLEMLAQELKSAGNADRFEVLKGYLICDSSGSYADAAGQLDLSEGAVRVAVHRLRQRFGELLHQEITHTLDDPQDVEDEISCLFRALQA